MEMTSIHNEFHSVLNNYISKRVSNPADVQDLLQEVFIKVHKNTQAIGRRESLKSWLFRITQNTIIDYYRKNANLKHVYDEKALEKQDHDDQPFDRTKELERCIHRFINELPEAYRAIIVDSEIKGISQKDLAVKYGLAYPSLRARVQRGRARLREMFLECCHIELDRRGNILKAIPKPKKCEEPASTCKSPVYKDITKNN